MTSTSKSPITGNKAVRSQIRDPSETGQWVLQDAKARFSELVRRVHSDGPQRVTVHGRDEVVVLSAKEFNRMKGANSGQGLIEVLQSVPSRSLLHESPSIKAHVRDVKL
jgi:prevent-host-death family protein